MMWEGKNDTGVWEEMVGKKKGEREQGRVAYRIIRRISSCSREV